MYRNQIVVLMISLSCILILIAAGVYFLVANTPSSINGGGMMGGGTSTTPESSFWIISAGLFGAAVIAIVLIIYFILPKNRRAEETQSSKDQPSSERSSAQADLSKQASKTLTLKEPKGTDTPASELANKLRKNITGETGLNGLGVHGIAGRVTTGYMILDGLLYGGIPSNFAVALTSPACDERNSIINNFLENGVKEGDSTFYVTVDPTPVKELAEKMPSSFYLFICNPQANSFVKKFGNSFVLTSVQNLTEISIALNQAVRGLPPSLKGSGRVCIDIISDVLLEHGPILARRWLTELITGLRSAGFTTLAVINPQMHSLEDLSAILGLFEGEIDIRERTTAKGQERFLRIKRMSNQKYIKEEIRLTEE